MKIQNKIDLIETDKISQYEFNNRIHTEDQIAHISQSIKEFGFNQPLVLDGDLVILVGHGRFEAAKKLGLSKVPAVVLKDLTEAQKRAYRIIDNKLQNDSTWNIDNLTAELDQLESLGFDIEFCGLDDLAHVFEVDKSNITKKIEQEWAENGSASYISEDKTGEKEIKVHFKTLEDFQKFKLLMASQNINLTNDSKFFWFPDNTREFTADKIAV
jgi:ParB/RepB/Spo0J family partition protein